MKTYKVSGDDTLMDEQNHITPEVRRIIEELRPDLEKGRKYLIKKLNKLCLKYPKVPVFKNFLSSVYQKIGNTEQAYAVNQWLVKEHPNYLFGKINLAAELLLKEEAEKVPEILGDTMEISDLYPEREEFHLEEVIGFNTIAIQYFLAIDEIEDAEMRVKILEDLDEEHPKTLYAKELLQGWYYSRAAARMVKENQLRRNVVITDNRTLLQTTRPPQFHFPEQIGWLYENDLSIAHEKIRQILQLDSRKLIEDLEKMLQDSIARFDYFSEKVNEDDYDGKELDFPIHALLLLAALESEKSLTTILELLKQDEKYNELWFGDFINDVMEFALYHCGRNQIRLLFEFLKLPNIFDLNKAVVGECLVEIVQDSNVKREIFVEEYRKVLNVFIEKANDENYADTDAIGFIISDITDLSYKELLPEIKQLFDLDLVGFWICGTYDEIKTDIEEEFFGKNLEFINQDIYEKYNELSRYEEEAPASPPNEDFITEMYNRELMDRAVLDDNFNEPIVKSKKIGRNDPCPCGSGKKYKKCCINK